MWTTCHQVAVEIALLIQCCAQGQCPATYEVQALYGPYCQFTGYAPANLQAINDAGIACGAVAECGKAGDMVIWNGQQAPVVVPLPPGSVGAGPFAINDNGEIAGIAEIPSGQYRGWAYINNQSVLLATLPNHNWAEAYAIANDGTIVGYSNGSPVLVAVMWKALQPIALVLPLGPKSVANDINGNGDYICGWMGVNPNPHFGSTAFRWHAGDVIDLGVLPGTTSSEANGVNNQGDICGIAYAPVGKFEMIRHGFFWSDGVMQDIGLLRDFVQTHALALNDAKQVVGYCDTWPLSSFNHGFIWQYGSMFDLNDLIPPESNLTIRIAWDINNAGQIVAYAIDSDGNQVGVILTPIPSAIGDFDFNCIINVDDLLGVINHWNKTTGPADFTQDGIVNHADLAVVIENWTL